MLSPYFKVLWTPKLLTVDLQIILSYHNWVSKIFYLHVSLNALKCSRRARIHDADMTISHTAMAGSRERLLSFRFCDSCFSSHFRFKRLWNTLFVTEGKVKHASRRQQIQYLTLAPESWTVKEVKEFFWSKCLYSSAIPSLKERKGYIVRTICS